MGDTMLILLALAAAGTNLTTTTKPPIADPNKIVCRDLGRTGSRLASDRVCMTRHEWDERQRADQKDVSNMQTNMGRCPNGQDCGS